MTNLHSPDVAYKKFCFLVLLAIIEWGLVGCEKLCRSRNISAAIGQYASCLSNCTERAITRALKWLFFTAGQKKGLGISCVLIWRKKAYIDISKILLKLWLIGNRTSCRPIRSLIILVTINKQIGLPLRGRPIFWGLRRRQQWERQIQK